MSSRKHWYNFYRGLFLWCLFWIGSDAVQAVNPRGASGPREYNSRQANQEESVQLLVYSLELFPGQVFTGWYYFWLVSGDPITADLREEIDQEWLSFSPTTFTSSSCDDIQKVAFTFQAPEEPGFYTVTITDANLNWDDIQVNLTVTTSPQVLETRNLEIPTNGTEVQLDTIGWYGFGYFSCLEFYLPGDSAQTRYSLYPEVDWLEITPWQMKLEYFQSAIIQKDFTISEPGSFDVYEIFEFQWYSVPRVIHWQVNVVSSLEDNGAQKIPRTFSLGQNYPNPFNPETIIHYELPNTNYVNLSVYNLLGQKMITLVDESQTAGGYNVEWDASTFTSGIYYYRIESGEFQDVKKMVLVR